MSMSIPHFFGFSKHGVDPYRLPSFFFGNSILSIAFPLFVFVLENENAHRQRDLDADECPKNSITTVQMKIYKFLFYSLDLFL
jgi:hypothetical protein